MFMIRYKVKIISGSDQLDLQANINDFLETFSENEWLKDIKLSSTVVSGSGSAHYTDNALIIYYQEYKK